MRDDFRGRDLKAWRKARGLKGKQVAEILGYSTAHISRCENGKANLSANAWRTLIASYAAIEIE